MGNNMKEYEKKMVDLLLEAIDQNYINEDTIGQFTYEYLAALLRTTMLLENGKDFYLQIKSYLEQINLTRLRKQEKIVVGFIVNYSSTWIGDELYNLLDNSERFEPYIFLMANYIGLDERMVREEYEKNLAFFQKKRLRIVGTLNLEDGRLYTWEEIGFRPEICIWTTPWMGLFHSDYRLEKYPLSVLHTYIPYGYLLAENKNATFVYDQYNQLIHNVAWKIFECTAMDVKMAHKYSFIGDASACYTGYPKMDKFYQYEKNGEDIWEKVEKKSGKKKAKRIIYAPHHSIEDEGTVIFSTFQYNYNFMLELAQKYENETIWILKPHPQLKYKAIRAGIFENEEEWEKYINSWKSLKNAYVMEKGDYKDLFLYSDAMILDSISFLAEYLYADKPGLFLCRPEQYFNDIGQGIKGVYYLADGKSKEEIRKFVADIVIGQRDYKHKERQELFKENMDYVNMTGKTAAENIYNKLKEL